MAATSLLAEEAPLHLRVSDNKHFLSRADGTPFFYLGDTAWELFHRLNREQAEAYLQDRAKKGYTVIQAVVLAEENGLHDPNAYGQLPLHDDDPARPNGAYFEHVDWIVNKAAALGLTIGMLPTWGDKWNKKWGQGPEIFNAANAEQYGAWLGERYAEKPIIWILGGDRPIENDNQRETIRAMARGLRRGDGGAHLMTLHPSGGATSAQWFHGEEWLDFNMRQNGHAIEWNGRYEHTHQDYERTPTKPVLDGEPVYEDHPVNFKPGEFGYSVAADVRRALYWDLFGGACGHTYGNHAVWQMYDPQGRPPVNNPLLPLEAALQQPGAGQMQYGRRLLESRPYYSRIPDDLLIVPGPVPAAIPGNGTRRLVATRNDDGSYAMIYVPVGRKFSVHLEKLSGDLIQSWWFNPRDGSAQFMGEFVRKGDREFIPPAVGESEDWVLVLDDSSKGFPPPGAVSP